MTLFPYTSKLTVAVTAVLVWARVACGLMEVVAGTRWSPSLHKQHFSSPVAARVESQANKRQKPSQLHFANRIGSIDSKQSLTCRVPVIRGGGSSGGSKAAAKAPFETGSKCPVTGTAAILASLWGSGGVIYILGKAIRRVLPIAMEPFQAGGTPLTSFQLG
jgi:hypothetical protein